MYTESMEISGRTFSLETGTLAKQAGGSVKLQYAETAVLTAATAGKEKDLPFLPLTVEYRERTAAAGKFPGGFIKREGKPSTKETLTCRLTDRPIRPLFPDGISRELQVITYVLSADQENNPDILSVNGASAALMLSDIPFNGPIGCTRIGSMDNNLIVNPTHSELEYSRLDLVVVSTEEGVVMVEGHGSEVEEDLILEGIDRAHQVNQKICEKQKKLAEEHGREKFPHEEPEYDDDLKDTIRDKMEEPLQEAIRTPEKTERSEQIQKLEDEIVEDLCEPGEDEERDEEELPDEEAVKSIFNDLQKELIREDIKNDRRIDGRDKDEIRPISCDAGYLPRTHGSALFTRGETQALVTTTLGTSVDEQVVDGLTEEYSKKFMVHYNFPPFCVGETRRMTGPGRREIGHGMLAERAVMPVLPEIDNFPYTIRCVSEILESNGSSSMATVCGSSLALMDAGVKLQKPVAGVAVGLIRDKEEEENHILTDILGDEDHCGDMDLKVAGSRDGITAVQMDIKLEQVSQELLRKALDRAREGRHKILDEMNETIDEPREDLSPHAPRLHHMEIDPEKIGLIIGPGGETIREIEDETGASLEIHDEGIVTISCTEEEGATKAINRVKELVYEPQEGEVLKGEVTGVKDFGAFVKIPGGDEGLCHISELEDDYVNTVEEVVNVGDEVEVKILEIDGDRIRLSRRAAKEEHASA